ncbi:hypothetical protein B296_00055437 [Ensete ventricosum]|uniref:Uncharacterized protein n=1 Tax=Ensete ventricosum TaxID=4639 RepID=A0A426X1W5_ENSVE|nr:hypothetical protein B296_00055437 [Ensete ventricosum]
MIASFHLFRSRAEAVATSASSTDGTYKISTDLPASSIPFLCGNRGLIYFVGDLFPTSATSLVSGSANAPATLAPVVTSPTNTLVNAVPAIAPGPATAQGPAASC